MAVKADCHSSMVLAGWQRFIELIGLNAGEVALDGNSLDLETVVAVAR